MRVVAGHSRGRVLKAPPGGSTRPTSDRVREAIFDMLGSILDLDDAHVADLFAGSGAMGIEALSRGAGRAVFVEKDPVALRAVRANLTSVGLGDAPVRLVKADVLKWVGSRRGGEEDRFDLAFVDPPYAFGDWARLLELLDSEVAVLESGRELEIPQHFDVVRSRRYGGTLVTVVRAAAHRPFVRGAS